MITLAKFGRLNFMRYSNIRPVIIDDKQQSAMFSLFFPDDHHNKAI